MSNREWGEVGRDRALGLKKVCSVPQATNPPSAAVCERIGNHLERQVIIAADERRGTLDGLLDKMTRDEWWADISIYRDLWKLPMPQKVAKIAAEYPNYKGRSWRKSNRRTRFGTILL